MFEDLLSKLTSDKQYASILEKLERELNKVLMVLCLVSIFDLLFLR